MRSREILNTEKILECGILRIFMRLEYVSVLDEDKMGWWLEGDSNLLKTMKKRRIYAKKKIIIQLTWCTHRVNRHSIIPNPWIKLTTLSQTQTTYSNWIVYNMYSMRRHFIRLTSSNVLSCCVLWSSIQLFKVIQFVGNRCKAVT